MSIKVTYCWLNFIIGAITGFTGIWGVYRILIAYILGKY